MASNLSRRAIVAAGIATGVVGFALYLALQNDWKTNVGFLVLGIAISLTGSFLEKWVSHPKRVRDLASLIHIELADRVARCCFDYETTWRALDPTDDPHSMSIFRLQKFMPNKPEILPAQLGQISLLPKSKVQTVLFFYFRLSAWERDIKNVTFESRDNPSGNIAPGLVKLLKFRLHETLAPGLEALECLRAEIEGAEDVEAKALSSYERKTAVTTPLLERLRANK